MNRYVVWYRGRHIVIDADNKTEARTKLLVEYPDFPPHLGFEKIGLR